jgi:23S rRNA (cytosine1962-C5)-methyltransferase
MGRRRTVQRLTVGAATARALRAGHPWVLPDRFTGSLSGVESGHPLELVGPGGERLGRALADPQQRVVARRVGESGEPFDPIARARKALERRHPLGSTAETDAYRVIHGEADGLPGLHVDRYGDALVAVRRAPCAASFCAPVLRVLRDITGAQVIWEKDHFADLRRGSVHGRLVLGQAEASDERIVTERGLRFAVRPFGGLATGLFADQRANRDRLARLDAPGRVLNLFSYTGAFSVAALAAGATEVVDVDLAGPALRTARHNVRLNELDGARHHTERGDAIAYLDRCPPRSFDRIIADPPTAARGGGGWSVRKGLPGLLGSAVSKLRDGGVLLICVNDRRANPGDLERALREAARTARRPVARIAGAGPSPDYPVLRGFPESRSFVGRVLQLR